MLQAVTTGHRNLSADIREEDLEIRNGSSCLMSFYKKELTYEKGEPWDKNHASMALLYIYPQIYDNSFGGAA